MAIASPARGPDAPPPEGSPPPDEPPQQPSRTLREATASYLAEVVYRLVLRVPPLKVATRRLAILVGAATSAEFVHRAIEHLR
jgi:hypothetical protein